MVIATGFVSFADVGRDRLLNWSWCRSRGKATFVSLALAPRVVRLSLSLFHSLTSLIFTSSQCMHTMLALGFSPSERLNKTESAVDRLLATVTLVWFVRAY